MAIRERLLPWRRDPERNADGIATLLDAYRDRHPGAATDRIERAFAVAAAAHNGQFRRSGEAYIHHPLEVATIVARQGLDDVSIAAALLHDAVEDTEVALDQLADEFGEDVALIVDGCTKVDRLKFETKAEQQAASMRKMLIALAKDLRVLIIKLADRLHNMRTVAALPQFKQERVARETLEIYAPLAHRLGMQDVKMQLEDLSFATLHPKRYSEIHQMVHVRAPERDLYLTQIVADVEARLAELGINAETTGRPKHLWSIYEKMVVKGRSFEDIHDLVGIRVIVDNVRDCYAALGSIHATWKPVQGRFKDFIAMPKFNLYQSLHTTVIGPQGKQVEVQIRTRDMHRRAEYGVAAHFDYKASEPGEEMTWLNRIVEWQEETSDPSQFMANLKVDLEQDEVYAFTPQGDVVPLPVGATPVDFAYTVHTEVGHSCIGARVAGRLVPLDTRLTSGDTVEIITSKVEGAGPSQDWLKFVASHRAANKIRQWHSRERRSDAIEHGREDLTAELRRAGLPIAKVLESDGLVEVAQSMNYQDLDSMYGAIGEGHLDPEIVLNRVDRAFRDNQPDHPEQLARSVPGALDRAGQAVPAPDDSPNERRSESIGVHAEGFDDVLIRLSRCCTPVPPDEIIGFATRGRGVSVHRTDCPNADEFTSGQPDRLVDVEWDEEASAHFVAGIEVKALDRPRLLRDMAIVLADNDVNVLSCVMNTGADRVAKAKFEFEMGDPSHLDALMRTIRDIDSIYDVCRVVPK